MLRDSHHLPEPFRPNIRQCRRVLQGAGAAAAIRDREKTEQTQCPGSNAQLSLQNFNFNRPQAAVGLLQRFVNGGKEADGCPTRDRLKLIPRVVNVDEWATTAPLSGTVRGTKQPLYPRHSLRHPLWNLSVATLHCAPCRVYDALDFFLTPTPRLCI